MQAPRGTCSRVAKSIEYKTYTGSILRNENGYVSIPTQCSPYVQPLLSFCWFNPPFSQEWPALFKLLRFPRLFELNQLVNPLNSNRLPVAWETWNWISYRSLGEHYRFLASSLPSNFKYFRYQSINTSSETAASGTFYYIIYSNYNRHHGRNNRKSERSR